MELKQFPHPLDTPILSDEEVEKTVPIFDPESKQVSYQNIKEKVRVETTYHYAPRNILSCERGKHQYIITDKKKYIASCTQCYKNRFLSPLTVTLHDGHVIDRKTKQIID